MANDVCKRVCVIPLACVKSEFINRFQIISLALHFMAASETVSLKKKNLLEFQIVCVSRVLSACVCRSLRAVYASLFWLFAAIHTILTYVYVLMLYNKKCVYTTVIYLTKVCTFVRLR